MYASPVKQGGGPSFGNLDDSPPSSLGEGVDVLKLQVAINCGDRSRNSILGELFFLYFVFYMQCVSRDHTRSNSNQSRLVTDTNNCTWVYASVLIPATHMIHTTDTTFFHHTGGFHPRGHPVPTRPLLSRLSYEAYTRSYKTPVVYTRDRSITCTQVANRSSTKSSISQLLLLLFFCCFSTYSS